MRPFVLVNANIYHPTVSPVGMEYVGLAVAETGIPVEVLDLAIRAGLEEGTRRNVFRH